MAKQPKSGSKLEPKSKPKRGTGAKASTTQKAPKAPKAPKSPQTPKFGAATKVTLERVKQVVEHYRPLLMGVRGVQDVTAGLKQTEGYYAHQLGQPHEYCGSSM